MANLGQTYDASQGDGMSDTSALPAGEYEAMIVKSEIVETKSGTGKYINIEFEVTGSEGKGRRFWTMLNLWNQNAMAVEIAQREFNSICRAVGKLQVQDTEELHGLPMRVKLSVKNDGNYGPKNVAKAYKPFNAPAETSPPSDTGSTSGGATEGPWKKTA